MKPPSLPPPPLQKYSLHRDRGLESRGVELLGAGLGARLGSIFFLFEGKGKRSGMRKKRGGGTNASVHRPEQAKKNGFAF